MVDNSKDGMVILCRWYYRITVIIIDGIHKCASRILSEHCHERTDSLPLSHHLQKEYDILWYLRKHSPRSRFYGHTHRLDVCILSTSYQDADYGSIFRFGCNITNFIENCNNCIVSDNRAPGSFFVTPVHRQVPWNDAGKTLVCTGVGSFDPGAHITY